MIPAYTTRVLLCISSLFYSLTPPGNFFGGDFESNDEAKGQPPVAEGAPVTHSHFQAAEEGASTTCKQGGQIPFESRTAIEAGSMLFVQSALKGDADTSFNAMSPDARAQFGKDKFSELVTQVLAPMSPFSGLRVIDTYLGEAASETNPPPVVCGRGTELKGSATFKIRSGTRQAFVILGAETRNNGWAFVVGLAPEAGMWRVNSFYPGFASAAGKTAQDFLEMADEESKNGHDFNAFVLLASARDLAYRGPDLQSGIESLIGEKLGALVVPQEIQGQPPYLWGDKNEPFRIMRVGPMAIAGKFYVVIAHGRAPWNSEGEVDQGNRKLITFFVNRFPEYSAVFAGVIAEAHEIGSSRGYRTVEGNDEILRQAAPSKPATSK